MGSAEAHASSPVTAAPHWSSAPHEQAYNLCLSEMRHYQDDDTMVLVLSQRAGDVQEAEYPVPMEQDTSELLEDEDDDVLAGYAQAATRLLKPSPQSDLDEHNINVSLASTAPYKYDDVSHERFVNATYEAIIPEAAAHVDRDTSEYKPAEVYEEIVNQAEPPVQRGRNSRSASRESNDSTDQSSINGDKYSRSAAEAYENMINHVDPSADKSPDNRAADRAYMSMMNHVGPTVERETDSRSAAQAYEDMVNHAAPVYETTDTPSSSQAFDAPENQSEPLVEGGPDKSAAAQAYESIISHSEVHVDRRSEWRPAAQPDKPVQPFFSQAPAASSDRHVHSAVDRHTEKHTAAQPEQPVQPFFPQSIAEPDPQEILISSPGPPRSSAMRRSSRHDAHMRARIASLDTSNLSTYSAATLRRLAKDLGLSNTYKLSKSELVVQLVSEIILANMSRGWGAPEVAHGAVDEFAEDDGYSSSDDEDSTVYKFSEGRHDVSVEQVVPQGTLQRGRDSAQRLTLERGGEAAAALTHDAYPGRSSSVPEWQQHDVDADFESMSKLSMTELQKMCEDMRIEGWASMRKFEMISRLLMDVYEI